MFAEIFSHFYQPINPSNNWDIVQVPSTVADDIVGKIAGSNINQLLILPIPKSYKIAILVNAYQFTIEDATAMVPNDDEIDRTVVISPPKDIKE